LRIEKPIRPEVFRVAPVVRVHVEPVNVVVDQRACERECFLLSADGPG
jgi:hypothetical protein